MYYYYIHIVCVLLPYPCVKARPESMISSPMKIHGKKGSNGT